MKIIVRCMRAVICMAMETNMGQASRFGMYEMTGLGWDFANRFPDEISNISADDIAQTAQHYFIPAKVGQLINHRNKTV